MDVEKPSWWYALPQEIVMQVVAHADLDTKENLRSVNGQLSEIARKKNIEHMLSYFPCVLSRQDHLDCMVQYAKKDDGNMMWRLIQTASYCNHADWVQVIHYFLAGDAHELDLLNEYEFVCPNDVTLEPLFPCIMAIYRGDEAAIHQYKINFYEGMDTWEDSIRTAHIKMRSPLHIAVEKNHPFSIVQLLLSQDRTLLNVIDNSYNETPVMAAVSRKNVNMCKFLLSCDDTKPDKTNVVGWTLLRQAYRFGSFEIVMLVTDYYNKHKIQNINNDFDLCEIAIQGRNKESIKFLLDSVSLQVPEAFELFKNAVLHCFDAEIIEMLLEKFAIDINALSDYGYVRYEDDPVSVTHHTIFNVTILYYVAFLTYPMPPFFNFPHSYVEVVKFLLDHGADPDIADANDKKPIDATENDDVKTLLRARMKSLKPSAVILSTLKEIITEIRKTLK